MSDDARDLRDWQVAGEGGRALDEYKRRLAEAPNTAEWTGQELLAVNSEHSRAEHVRRKAAPQFVDVRARELLQLGQAGKDAMTSLWIRHNHVVEYIAATWSRGDQQAKEDIAADTWLSLWLAARSNPIQQTFRRLVHTAARNAGQRYQRNVRTRRLRERAAFEEALRRMEGDRNESERMATVQSLAPYLPAATYDFICERRDPVLAELFKLRVVDGHTYKELAAHFNVSIGTISTRLSRLRTWLLARQTHVLRHAQLWAMQSDPPQDEAPGGRYD